MSDVDEELCQAAFLGMEGELQGMLQAGRSADATDRQGIPAIVCAVHGDQLGAMRILLAAGADTEKRDSASDTALTLAARKGRVELVPELLANGADRAAKGDEGLTAGEWAKKKGHTAVLGLLSLCGGGGAGGGAKAAAEKAAAQKAAAEQAAAEEAEPPYAAELAGLSFNMLKRRAKALGGTDAQLEDLDDEDDPMAAAVALALSLRHALDGMKLKALKAHLRAIGATGQQIEDLGEGTSPKVAAIALVLDIASAGPGGAPAAPSQAPAAVESEPHPKPTLGAQESHGQRILPALGADQDFHLVFSNKTNWDALCLEVRGKLALGGVRIWQQRTNIPKDSDNWFSEWYPSAVRARKIVCFISVDYLKSPYCMKEWRVAESKNKLLVVACEPLSQIAAVDPSAYPHASNALAYLDGGGQVIFNGQDDIVAEIRKFI